MPAPKGNSNATKPGIEKTLRIRFENEEALQIALDMPPAGRGRAMAELPQTGVYDYYGEQVKLGDTIRESHYIGPNSYLHNVETGKIRYVRGCHVIDFGKRGTYSFHERYPHKYGDFERRWEVISRD